MKSDIYQIVLPHDAAEGNKALEAYRRLGMGSKTFIISDLIHYEKVAEVDTLDKNKIFELMNLWEDESLITRLKPLHSLSVGDIIAQESGLWMVDWNGFTKLELKFS